ncbi:MAG: electron transport complex subunit RsxG [Pseudomonadota bacterium]
MTTNHSAVRAVLTMVVIATFCAILIAATHHWTADQIAANEQARLEQSLVPALAGLDFDGSVSGSLMVLQPPHDLPGDDAAEIYRVYADGEPAAALIAVTARGGFSGPIRILVGVHYDGTVTGVRILEHQETPGLGDKIESKRSRWVFQFDERSLADPTMESWAIRADGGDFDQITGASVTPRAVIKAIRDTLIYFNVARDELFAAPVAEANE